MARVLPLYPKRPVSALESVEPIEERDPSCTRCAKGKSPALSAKAKTPCIDADGEPGGLLVVAVAPTKDEDAHAKPFFSAGGLLLRRALRELWKGPMALSFAVRCPVGEKGPTDFQVEACRPYLASTWREAAPTRIVTLGAAAALSVLGRSVGPFFNRRTYSFVDGDDGPIPVFPMFAAGAALQNEFVGKWFRADLEWALTARPKLPPWGGRVIIVDDLETAKAAVAAVSSTAFGAFDVETAGRMFSASFRVVSCALAGAGTKEAWVWTREALAPGSSTLRVLLDYMGDESRKKVGQNVKYDQLSFLAAFGARVRGVFVDTRLIRKLVDPEAPANLAAMSELIGMGGMKEDGDEAVDVAADLVKKRLMLVQRERKKGVDIAPDLCEVVPRMWPELEAFVVDRFLENGAKTLKDVPEAKAWAYGVMDPDTLHRYNGRDAVSTAALVPPLLAELDAVPPLRRTWDTIVQPASEAVQVVEAWGVAVDRNAIIALDGYLAVQEARVLEKLNGYKPIKWSSRDQIADFLFRELKLPPFKLTDSGDESTDKESLEHLKHLHPVCEHLVEYRRITKLRGTYAAGLLPYVREDGRIHPSILLDGARSGRTSCANPNLQNQPRPSSPEAKMVRDLFIAAQGYKLVSLDYSQLELRVAAYLANDPAMIAIFLENVDYHQRTAELISQVAWGITPDKVTKEHRSFAKTINFGLVYGKGDGTIAEEFGITIAEAAKIRAAILGTFKKLDEWCKMKTRESKRSGEAWTIWNGQPARRRSLFRIGDKGDAGSASRKVAENGAVNTPIQGTASDYCIASLTACVAWLLAEKLPARLVLPIHDALLFEVRDDYVDEVASGARDIMQSWDAGGVPLVVDCEVGDAWGSLMKYKMVG